MSKNDVHLFSTNFLLVLTLTCFTLFFQISKFGVKQNWCKKQKYWCEKKFGVKKVKILGVKKQNFWFKKRLIWFLTFWRSGRKTIRYYFYSNIFQIFLWQKFLDTRYRSFDILFYLNSVNFFDEIQRQLLELINLCCTW